jgi:hypothetical protein
MHTGVMPRRTVDIGALVAGLVMTGLGVLLLLDFLDVLDLGFGTLWPILLAAAGAILLALGLASPRQRR